MFDCRGKEIYLICGATDMRKGIDGLSSIINLRLVCDAFDSALFIFCNRNRNRVKILEWDRDGFWLYQKRLERGTFPWPKDGKIKKITLSKEELSCLLGGTKLRRRLSMDEVAPGFSS
jgi:transposase